MSNIALFVILCMSLSTFFLALTNINSSRSNKRLLASERGLNAAHKELIAAYEFQITAMNKLVEAQQWEIDAQARLNDSLNETLAYMKQHTQ